MRDSEDFKKVKELCKGYLETAVYEEIYKCGLNAKEGIVVDIGPAQGGSTISLGLALTENKNLKKIYSIDTFCNSAALKSFESIAENIEQLYSNLDVFGLKNCVTALVAGRDNLSFMKNNEKIAVLFIDADGALDRDFDLYYNYLTEGAFIIIDDYKEEINFQASMRYLTLKDKTSIDLFLQNQKIESMADYMPLGKKYTIFKFVDYFTKKGFIEEFKLLGDTIFLRKPENAPLFTAKNKEDLKSIRREIEKEYYRRHEIMRSFYDKLNNYLSESAKLLKMDLAYLFENHLYKANNKWLTVQVDIWENEMDKNNIILDSIYFEYINSIVKVLKDRKILSINVDELAETDLKMYFRQLGYKYLIAIPVFLQSSFWGFMLFLSKETFQASLEASMAEIEGILDSIVTDIEKNKSIKDKAVAV